MKLFPRLDYRYSLSTGLVAFKGLIFKKFNKNKAEIFKGRELLFVNHARTGIRIALSALNLPLGSGIGVMVYNCHTVFQAIKEANLTPVFIDITYDFKLNLDSLKCEKHKIRALIVTHLFGIPNDIGNIKSVLGETPIIEDCAHSFLSEINNKYTGQSGDIAVFSIGKGKFPSIGNGGFVLANCDIYYERLKNKIARLPHYSFIHEIYYIFLSYILSILHIPIVYGLITYPILKKRVKNLDLGNKYKNNEAQMLTVNKSVFLNISIGEMEVAVNKKKKNAFDNLRIIDLSRSNCPFFLTDAIHESNFFMLPVLTEYRDELIVTFRKQGIELGKHFSQSINWAKEYGYLLNSCPNAENVSKSILTIPTYYKFSKTSESIN